MRCEAWNTWRRGGVRRKPARQIDRAHPFRVWGMDGMPDRAGAPPKIWTLPRWGAGGLPFPSLGGGSAGFTSR